MDIPSHRFSPESVPRCIGVPCLEECSITRLDLGCKCALRWCRVRRGTKLVSGGLKSALKTQKQEQKGTCDDFYIVLVAHRCALCAFAHELVPWIGCPNLEPADPNSSPIPHVSPCKRPPRAPPHKVCPKPFHLRPCIRQPGHWVIVGLQDRLSSLRPQRSISKISKETLCFGRIERPVDCQSSFVQNGREEQRLAHRREVGSIERRGYERSIDHWPYWLSVPCGRRDGGTVLLDVLLSIQDGIQRQSGFARCVVAPNLLLKRAQQRRLRCWAEEADVDGVRVECS